MQESINTNFTFSYIQMSNMDQLYGDYCKKHEDALCRIQELNARPSAQAFFTVCFTHLS
jgi:hypothetical protein